MKRQILQNEYLIQSIQERDRMSVWHPYAPPNPPIPSLPIASGDGAYLIDITGKRYLDATSSWWVNIHGHNHPRLNLAIQTQLQKLAHTLFAGITHEPAILLAETLLSWLPSIFSKVFYSDNGSTSLEVALKIMYQYWNCLGQSDRTLFVTVNRSYHGDTFGGMTIGNSPEFHQMFSRFMFPKLKLPAPNCSNCELNLTFPQCNLACATELESTLQQYGSRVAAVVIEPLIMGAGGMIMPPEDYLPQILAICKRRQIPWIADEVFTGFGRTGTMFASINNDYQPAILCLSKGITGGYLPLGATICQNFIVDGIQNSDKHQNLYHGHSYTANPLACAVSYENLNIFSDDNTLQRVQEISALFIEEMHSLQKTDGVLQTRSRGAVAAVELDPGGQSAGYFADVGQKIALWMRQAGIYLRPLGNVIYFAPPYIITNDEIRHFFMSLKAAITETFDRS